MSDALWLDYETKSKCDLLVHGAYNYAQDPSTAVLCLGYAFNDEEPALWWPGQPVPERIAKHFRGGGRIYAHNSGFDRLITEFVFCPDTGVPTPPLSSWYCTAVQAASNCAPRSLEDVGRFAGTAHRKNHRGSALIRLLCLPRPDGTFNDDPALMHEMGVYCLDDIRTMRETSKAMRPLSDIELRDYHINEKINDRGALIDRSMAQAAQRYSIDELEEVQALVKDITEGVVTTVRSPNMKEWCLARMGEYAKKLCEVWEDGEMRYSFDKSIRANLLLMEDYAEVPPEVMDVIQCADDIWSSSVAKYKRLNELADFEDDRVRGAFVFNGGAATGRASSYGAQVHNFTRKVAKNPQEIRDALVADESIVPRFGKRVTDVLKSMLRPTILASPGKTLIVSDWSKIEAVLNPWLSNSPKAEAVLDIFRSGRDLYAREAAGIYRVPEQEILAGVEAEIDKYNTMRQNGKVAVLACGFGGSVGAFAAMGRNYGVVMHESEARQIVNAWRRANPWAPEYWDKLEDAYTCAMRHPHTEFTAGRVTYMFDGLHLWYALPSGRILCYPYARLEADGVTYAKSAWKPKANATDWPRARLWKGLACENCWSGNTRLVTDSGIKCIQDILPDDLIWDGYEFVRHDGVINNGEQEVMQWSDVFVTQQHLIFDGKTWSAVIALTESTIDRSLKWGRSLANWKSYGTTACPKMKAGAKSNALAEVLQQSFLGRLNEGVFNVFNAFKKTCLKRRSLKNTAILAQACRRSYAHLGCIVAQASYRGAAILNALCTSIMAHAASISISPGLTRPNFGLSTQSRSRIGTYLDLTSTESTTTKAMCPAIYGSAPGLKTPITDAVQSKLLLKVKKCLFAIFGESTAPNGVAITRLSTILKRARPATKLPRIIKERKAVYDIKNCGPRHQYLVITDMGYLIAHNCCQATANDLLREALFKCDEDGIPVILHCHDEIVSEVDETIAEDELRYQEAIMLERPSWGLDIPIAVESKIMKRYGK